MHVYLDHAATTPLRDEVVAEMARVADLGPLNPSSRHRAGRRARRVLDDAREELASHLGARPGEVVFTSGGTEADDLAVNGVAAARPGVLLCSAVEHDAVRAPVVQRDGSLVAVDRQGRVDLEDLERRLVHARDTEGVALVSVMAVNNENGVRQPLDDVAELVGAIAPGAPLHTDAVQAAPWLDLAQETRVADLVSISGHKLGAPVGVGALVVRDGVPLSPRLRGGGQERERRSGTPNVVGAVALARAVALAAEERAAVGARVAELRDRLAEGIMRRCGEVIEPACPTTAARDGLVGGTVQLCASGVESEALLFLLDEAGVAASAGSACAAGALEPSHVLAAMDVPDEFAGGALRLSVGRTTTTEEIDFAIDVVVDSIGTLRSARAA